MLSDRHAVAILQQAKLLMEPDPRDPYYMLLQVMLEVTDKIGEIDITEEMTMQERDRLVEEALEDWEKRQPKDWERPPSP